MRCRLLLLLLVVAVVLTGFGIAYAEVDPLKVEMKLSTNRFTEPKEITVSISIINTGESDMPGTVTLYYPNGKPVEEFGSPVLSAGATKSWTGKWKVTQAQLDAGKLKFAVEYYVVGDDDQLMLKHKSFSLKLIVEDAQPATVITRQIQPTTAGKDQIVTITYEIANTGTVDITNVRIKENSQISKKTATIDVVRAGEKESYSFEVKMGTKDLTSTGEIQYKAGDKEYTEIKEAETIKYGEVKLSADLSVEGNKKGGVVGDTAQLNLTLTNGGTLAFEGVTVTDPTLGEVFRDVSVPAGEKVTLTREVTIETTTDYQFSVTAKDETGMQIDTATKRVTITAIDPNQVVDLTIQAEADRSEVYELPGAVVFKVSVTNNSEAEMTNVAIRTSGYTINTFPKLAPHETRTFERELYVSMKGTYQFTAQVKDQLGATKTFESNGIRIVKATAPTPVPTDAPRSAPAKPVVQPTLTPLPADYMPPTEGEEETGGNGQILRALGFGLLVPVLVGGVLTLIGLINRIRAGAASRAALDHLQINGTRDYEQISEDEPEQEQPAEEQEAQPQAPPQPGEAGEPAKTEAADDFELAVEAALRRRQHSIAVDDKPRQGT